MAHQTAALSTSELKAALKTALSLKKVTIAERRMTVAQTALRAIEERYEKAFNDATDAEAIYKDTLDKFTSAHPDYVFGESTELPAGENNGWKVKTNMGSTSLETIAA